VVPVRLREATTELEVQESINRTKNIFNKSKKHNNKFLRTYPNIFS
jgi:hypothetical protein